MTSFADAFAKFTASFFAFAIKAKVAPTLVTDKSGIAASAEIFPALRAVGDIVVKSHYSFSFHSKICSAIPCFMARASKINSSIVSDATRSIRVTFS